MTDSTKIRLLKAIAKHGPIANPHSLQQPTGADTHTVVHMIYSLGKQNLIKFRLTAKPTLWKGKPTKGNVSRKIPTRIEITEKGRHWLDRQT